MAQFKCPKCGQMLENGTPQCPNCNAKFNWNTTNAAPQQPMQQQAQYQPYQQPQQAQFQQPAQYQQPQQPAKKKIKWWMIVIAVILVAALFKGCSGDDSTGGTDNTSNSSASAQKSNNEMQDKGTLGNYEVEILSAKLSKDYEGKDVVIIEYNFTNNGDDAMSFSVALIDKVFQDGIELEHSYFIDNNDYDAGNTSKEIKKGKSITVQSAFVLNDTTTPIEVEVSEFISLSSKKVIKTFDIA